MGYYVIMDLYAEIEGKHDEAALSAINGLGCGDWVDGGGKFTDLVDAIDSWRYAAKRLRGGMVEISEFVGQKWGDDEKFWQALAPYITDGGCVTCHGEDGEQWQYVFANGKMKTYRRSAEWVEE
jgi:hypothetical protein